MAANNNNGIIYLPLEDVESEHCALIVDKGLAQVNGIESHRVELNNRRAVIAVNSPEAVTNAVKTIKDLGYGVTTVKKNISRAEYELRFLRNKRGKHGCLPGRCCRRFRKFCHG